MKKVIAGFLALVLAFGLVACTNNANETSSGGTTTLSWYVPGDKQPDIDSVMAKVNEITVPEIGAEIDLQFIDTGSFDEKMRMMMASSTVFDMCFTGYLNKYPTAVSKGALIGLNDLMAKETPELRSRVPEYVWDALTVDGEIYAVPNYQVHALSQSFVTYNKYLDQYGFDPNSIVEEEDLEPLLANIKKDYPDVYPYRDYGGVWPWLTDYERLSGASNLVGFHIDDKNCEVKAVYEMPEFLQGIKTLRDWYNKGYIRSDVASVMDDSSEYRQGKYGVWQLAHKPGIEADLETTMGQPVTFMIYKDYVPYISTDSVIATMTGISRTSKNPEKSIRFLDLIQKDKELYNIVCFGLEGKHYEKVDDTHIKLIDGSGYKPNASWKFGNQFNAYLLEGQSDTVWEETIANNERAKKSKILGLSFDTTEIVTQISQCESIFNEYGSLFDGSGDYETLLPEFIQKMEEAGITKIIETYQKQIDAFLAK